MKQYSWKDNAPKPPVEADVFGAIKDRIESEKGIVQPIDIVEEARNPASPIHAALPWDDAKAAEAHRLDVARRLLSSLQVVRVQIQDGPSVSSRAMFRVRPEGSKGGYASRDKIVGDRELRKQVVASARRELESFLSKYAGVVALSRFVPRLQEVMDAMRDEIEQLEVDAARRTAPARADVEVEREDRAGAVA